MRADKARLLLPLLNSKVTGTRSEWILGHCPMAPFRHADGKDAHPSFGIKSSPSKTSICKCMSCGYGGELRDLIIDIKQGLRKNPDLIPLYNVSGAMQLIASEFADLEFDPDVPDYEKAMSMKVSQGVGTPYPEEWLYSFPKWKLFKEAADHLASRMVSPTMADHLDLRFDPLARRVCFPFRDSKGRLMGVQGRAIDKENPLRYYFYEWKKVKNMHVWMGENTVTFDKPVVLVEGPFDFASVYRVYPNVVASFTSGLSITKVKRLSDAVEIVTLYDFGSGGDSARERVDQVLKGVPVTHLIPEDAETDPGAMSLTEITEALRDHVTLAPFDNQPT